MSTHPQSAQKPASTAAKRTARDLRAMKQRHERIVMVTTYDAPSARLADAAGVDVVLIGDSAAMTVLGHDSTLPVTMDEMLMLTRAVVRGATRPLVVADMPFGSFQVSNSAARRNAVRFFKEGGVDAVKLEGAGPTLGRVRTIVDADMPVIGHLGLTPQSVKSLGGYKPQGRTALSARVLLDNARALEQAGCSALVLEAMPPEVAQEITRALAIPTIGIGAGVGCDGQVLVWHDLLGISVPPLPRFVKQYAALHDTIRAALEHYVADVRQGTFPGSEHTYAMIGSELDLFRSMLTGTPNTSNTSRS
jgi:3-methyl-2-oxobutanoate hydroxymethyltransferase